MAIVDIDRPRLRPVEAIPDRENGRLILRDPTQLAAGMLVVGQAELLLLTMLDGEHGLMEIQAEFARRSGQMLLSHELDSLLEQLGTAGYLDGEPFEVYYARLVEEYETQPFRPLRAVSTAGLPEADALPQYLDAALDAASPAPGPGRLVGLVTPHLDFERGLPCYSAGYRQLREELQASEAPRRVVILGTNHFGRSRSVVATGKDFQTPWGVLRTDREFLDRLQGRCGGNLKTFELDHLREHSVELQAIWLHHLLGDGARIVPVLCPDPSGPRGTSAGLEDGVDLREFSLALGELVRDDPEPTLFVASADLSHVGGYFGDRVTLDEQLLETVRLVDEAGIGYLERNDPEGLRERMAQTGNPTRWCSAGCLFSMMTALGQGAEPRRLGYHQAAMPELENCVTSTAFTFRS